MAYNGMMKIYRENTGTFAMAVAHLLDVGFRNVSGITDEQIENLEGNGLMTQQFVQDLVRVSREIAKECGNNVVEIVQFCAAENIFDTEYYSGRFENDEWDTIDDEEDLEW